MSSPRPTVNEEDARRADEVLQLWAASESWHASTALQTRPLRELRGILLAAFADARHAAYNEGYEDHAAGMGL